ncbi:MAG: hypothetical protein ACTHM6_05925 [Tepidisphaeraceae bacterium]
MRLLKVVSLFSGLLACLVVTAFLVIVTDRSLFGWQEPVGNKAMALFREGVDFRVSLYSHPPQGTPEDQEWGNPDHWLRLPAVEFSLWWPFGMSIVAPAWWAVARRRRKQTRGFAVVVRRDAG